MGGGDSFDLALRGVKSIRHLRWHMGVLKEALMCYLSVHILQVGQKTRLYAADEVGRNPVKEAEKSEVAIGYRPLPCVQLLQCPLLGSL